MFTSFFKASSKLPQITTDTSLGIVLQDICVNRNNVQVLGPVSFSLQQKRIGIIGGNGSGKSTLLRLFNGLLTPDSGSLTVHGLDANNYHQALARVVGFMFQNSEHQLIFPTVTEELAFGLRQQGLEQREYQTRVTEVLARYQLTELAERPVSTLSGGQKQLICMLSIILMNPEIIVFDEPFTGLDLYYRQKIISYIKTLSQQIIIVSHDLTFMEQMDRLLWLDNGQIIGDGLPADILPAYRRAVHEQLNADKS